MDVTLTPELVEMLRFLILRRLVQFYDAGGESMRSLNARMTEAVLYSYRHTMYDRPEFKPLRDAVERDPNLVMKVLGYLSTALYPPPPKREEWEEDIDRKQREADKDWALKHVADWLKTPPA